MITCEKIGQKCEVWKVGEVFSGINYVDIKDFCEFLWNWFLKLEWLLASLVPQKSAKKLSNYSNRNLPQNKVIKKFILLSNKLRSKGNKLLNPIRFLIHNWICKEWEKLKVKSKRSKTLNATGMKIKIVS